MCINVYTHVGIHESVRFIVLHDDNIVLRFMFILYHRNTPSSKHHGNNMMHADSFIIVVPCDRGVQI